MLRLDQVTAGTALGGVDDGIGAQPMGRPPAAESVLALAQAELLEFQSDALTETQEDLGFALGGRLRDNRRGGIGQDGARGRVLAQKLVAELAAVEAADLDSLLSGPQDWQRAPHLLAAMQAQTPDPGRMALQLAAWLAKGRPDAKLRRRMEEALAALTADDTLALSLFGALEYGATTPALRQELLRLYHRAGASRQKLSQWLASLGERDGRQRKLRTMLRVLSYELSASGQAIVGSHLAAVIGDLRQLLRILGLEAHCDQAAAALALPALDGETLLRGVVSLLEQVWVNADSVAEALPPVEPEQQYRLAHALGRLAQLLPEDCFGDAEQKAQLEAAVAELRDRSLE
ncbi:TyeA family type III secretion system gatekeeper subunit [Chromobacterium vaccinii]|uniref:TyeA family type III secretion system gatekeeper subunit n=1 Tax=Chromobacterium vaccinii TaxID=1108595 RepID=A0ABV0F7B7_9NEIS